MTTAIAYAATNNYSTNNTALELVVCEGDIPKAQELFRDHPFTNIIFLAIAGSLMLITILIFVEEVSFIVRTFEINRRKVLTIWVLAIYPVFSVCATLGLFVPRAGTIVDLVSNVYFSTCLYQFVRLMISYIGGKQMMWETLGETTVSLRGPPCCCCCFCCPEVHFSKTSFRVVEWLAFQVTLVRPFLHFIAAVMWANGSYVPGLLTLDNGYTYIAIMNLTSTFTAVYGLLLLQKTFKPVLESYQLGGKFLSIQSVLLLTVIPNIIINILVTNGVIPCTDTLPSKTRGERIYHGFVVCLMVPLSLMGRGFYRRKHEGKLDENMNGVKNASTMKPLVQTEDREMNTSKMSLSMV